MSSFWSSSFIRKFSSSRKRETVRFVGDTDGGSTGEGEEEGVILSADAEAREASEPELCPSAGESFELSFGTEFLLVSLVLLEEEEEDAAE